MTGRTGYTEYDNNLPPEGPAQMNRIFEHFDPLIGESVSALSDLPASGVWEGRHVWVSTIGQWFTRSGSGWVNTSGIRAAFDAPSMSAGWTWGAGSTLTRRVDEVRFEALLTRNTGITAGVQICVLPVGGRPNQIVGFNGVLVSGGSTGYFSGVASPDGSVTISAVSNATSTVARLNFSFLTQASW